MKIHLLSDIHNRPQRTYAIPKELDYDVLVVAGDIDEDPVALAGWLGAVSDGRPVVAVLGNHDYYDLEHESGARECFSRRFHRIQGLLSRFDHVHLLQNESVVIDGVQFLGATLWTSFMDGEGCLARYAGRCMRDFRLIGAAVWLRDPANRPDFNRACDELRYTRQEIAEFVLQRLFCPPVALVLHRRTVKFLKAGMRRDPNQKTIVITHHAPTLKSLDLRPDAFDRNLWTERLDARWENERIIECAAYGSAIPEWDRLPSSNVLAFLHGHIHQTWRGVAYGTALVCNSGHGFDFQDDLILDTDRLGTREHLLEMLQGEMDREMHELDEHFAGLERLASAAPPLASATPLHEAYEAAWQNLAERFTDCVNRAGRLVATTLAPTSRWADNLRNEGPNVGALSISPSLVARFANPELAANLDYAALSSAALATARDWRDYTANWREWPAAHDRVATAHRAALADAIKEAGLVVEILPNRHRWASDLVWVRCHPYDVERVFEIHRSLASARHFRLRIASAESQS